MKLQSFYEAMNENYDEVLDRMMGSEDFLCKMLQKFVQDTAMDKLTEAMEARDNKAVFEHDHALKGVCANLGLGLLGVLPVNRTVK